MQLRVHKTLAEILPQDWNRLAGTDCPFLRHEFLNALESSRCVSEKTGWQPLHLGIYEGLEEGPGATAKLIAAVPLYLKSHSYGEYIFDWAWANAYEQARINYYPKLSVAVPFTPVTGNRILISEDQDRDTMTQLLISGVLQIANEQQASSIHWLFTKKDEVTQLQQHQHLKRIGYQFHWKNNHYENFDHFLESFSSQKRKKVKRERRYVRDAGISLQVIDKDAITDRHWDTFYEFYYSTIRNHGAIPYLNREFFGSIGATMPENIVIIFAYKGDDIVAGSLNFRDEHSLYGRYWGSRGDFHSLHFETCYYRAIEYCIDQGLQTFEAGAQGEHKLSRGFMPTEVFSAHWLDHPEFNNAVADYLERERNGIEYQIEELNDHSPFKQTCQ